MYWVILRTQGKLYWKIQTLKIDEMPPSEENDLKITYNCILVMAFLE